MGNKIDNILFDGKPIIKIDSDDVMDILSVYESSLAKCIDQLSELPDKLGNNSNYVNGYKDACIAIKNSSYAIMLKLQEKK